MALRLGRRTAELRRPVGRRSPGRPRRTCAAVGHGPGGVGGHLREVLHRREQARQQRKRRLQVAAGRRPQRQGSQQSSSQAPRSGTAWTAPVVGRTPGHARRPGREIHGLACVIGSSSVIRAALLQAAYHARHRPAFGRPLFDQPLMRNVLADLSVEPEAATTAMLRLAGANDREVPGDESEAALRRLALAVTKCDVCKQASGMVGEALECLGGNGRIEDSDLPRLYREMPLLSVWEGSGNVAALGARRSALDALRTLAREPYAGHVPRRGRAGRGGRPPLRRGARPAQEGADRLRRHRAAARRVVDHLALVFQG